MRESVHKLHNIPFITKHKLRLNCIRLVDSTNLSRPIPNDSEEMVLNGAKVVGVVRNLMCGHLPVRYQLLW